MAHKKTARRQQLERAKGWYEELERDVPRNKQAPLTLGTIDWQDAHELWIGERAKAGMAVNAPGPVSDAAVRSEMATKCGPLWEHGTRELKHLLEIDPDNEQSMMYLSMILRERADTAASEAEYKQQIVEADEWAHKAAEVQNRKQQAAPGRE